VNPLIAARHDSTGAWDRFGIAENIRDVGKDQENVRTTGEFPPGAVYEA